MNRLKDFRLLNCEYGSLVFFPPAGSIFTVVLPPQVSSSGATSISQPILHLSGDAQAHVGQAQDLNSAGGQTLQSVQLVNPGTFLIQAQTVTATGQIQWQTFQVTCSHPPTPNPQPPHPQPTPLASRP